MKHLCLVFFCFFAMKAVFSQPGARRTIYEDSALMKEVTDALTYSISNRGYYIPIYTRCDSVSEEKLTLAPTIYLLDNYKKRNEISYDDFRELISSSIKEKSVLEGICPDDFEDLYGRDRVLPRSAVFICDTQSHEAFALIESMDVDSLISWAFNSDGCYYRSFKLLPIVAQRLLLYGVLLHTGQSIRDIWYDDIDRKYYKYLQSVTPNSDTSRVSNIQNRLQPPDSFLFEIVFIRRADTMFSIVHYPYKTHDCFRYLDTMYYESKRKWQTKTWNDKYTVYYLKKTSSYNHQIDGYVYKPRKIISYRKEKRVFYRIFFGKMCYTKRYE